MRKIVHIGRPAPRLGIKMGEPAFKIAELLIKNKAHVFSSNYALYGDFSRRVMDTISGMVAELEVYSIDECFVKLDGYPDLVNYAYKIRDDVKRCTGIPVSIGIAPTKTLAKLANRIAKKTTGVHVLADPGPVLKNTGVADIWGIGKRYTEFLNKNGIKTAFELTEMPDAWIKKNMHIVGFRLVEELYQMRYDLGKSFSY